MDARRVLTKFQINLVIPKKHVYVYISTGAVIYLILGIFINNTGKGIKGDLYNRVKKVNVKF